MRMEHVFVRNDGFEPEFDRFRRLAWRDRYSVRYAKDMRVDRHRLLSERHVENDVCSLATNPWQFDERIAIGRHDAAMLTNQYLRQRNDVPGLAAKKADGLDMILERLFAECEHLLGRVRDGEQPDRRLVDPRIGRLRRQDHRDKQRVGIAIEKLALGFGLGCVKAPEDFGDRRGIGRWPQDWLGLGGFGAGAPWRTSVALSLASFGLGLFRGHVFGPYSQAMQTDNPISDEFASPPPRRDPAQAGDLEIFARVLKPYRSLSRGGITVLLTVLALIGFAVSIPFYLMGAWPVAGFFGLDVLILYLAFRANMRSARACEKIAISHVEMLLEKISAKGCSRIWRFNPIWVRLQTERHKEFETQKIAVVHGRESVEVGRFLGADDKDDFLISLRAALNEAKRGRTYNP